MSKISAYPVCPSAKGWMASTKPESASRTTPKRTAPVWLPLGVSGTAMSREL